MRLVDSVILVLGLVAVLVWSTYSSKDGFKGSDALIVARSISFSATLGGHVDNRPPAVGSKLNQNDLLIRILNGRVDRTRLIELQAQRDYLESELRTATEAQQKLTALIEGFEQRAGAYRRWVEEDIELRHTIAMRRLEVARKRSAMKADEVARLTRLFQQQHTSKVLAVDAGSNAHIAATEAELVAAELERSALLLRTVRAEEVFSVDGDTNYWAKMADDLRLRFFDVRGRVALLKSELIRTMKQAGAEAELVASGFSEEHLAPFSGVVNAVFVTKGARVAPGTDLIQLLDCANPTVVIPIPAHRMGEFAVGMKATVFPVDSEDSLLGTVTHISSGPLLEHDPSIQLPPAVTLNGYRAIVTLEDASIRAPSASCETARNAVAVIHSPTLLDRVSSWYATLPLPE